MSVKYNPRVKYILRFDFKVGGSVQEPDIIGALLTLSASYNLKYSLVKLQNQGKVGKLTVKIKSQSPQLTSGILEIPVDLDRAQASIMAAVLESITRIKLYTAKIVLKDISDEQQVNSSKFLNRAVEIYSTYFETEHLDPENLKKTLFEITSSKKATSCEEFTLGSSFYSSENTIVVEGRADVLKLAQCNITNTFALGGVSFNTVKVSQYLKKKIITIFRDGDQGGLEIERRLALCCPITYVIETPKSKSVEDLSNAQIYDLVKSRKLRS